MVLLGASVPDAMKSLLEINPEISWRQPGIPAGTHQLLDPERKSDQVLALRAALEARVVGQPEAIDAVVRAYELYLAGLHPQRRPVASFLFLGPTGVGKTLTVEAAAEAILGEPKVLKIDCAEFQREHEIAKLMGSPPGYVGHRESEPRLSMAALNRHRGQNVKLALVLFDEIEKASEALYDLLLGILDKGDFHTGANEQVDFSNTMIFMTSNVGGREMQRMMAGHSVGFVPYKDTRNPVSKSMRKTFRPEFLGRIDYKVVFRPLEEQHLRRIVDIEIQGFIKRMILSQVFLFVDESFKEAVFARVSERHYGAREVKRTVENMLLSPLASMIASKQIAPGNAVRVEWNGNGPKFYRISMGAAA